MLNLPADPELPIYESVRRGTILDARAARTYRDAGVAFGTALRRINIAMASWADGVNEVSRRSSQED